MSVEKKFVYFFGGGASEGTASMRSLLGGKGANLADMASLGLPVPPGFTITTEACAEYSKIGKEGFSYISDVQQMNTLVTDSQADFRVIERLQEAGVQVIVANPHA